MFFNRQFPSAKDDMFILPYWNAYVSSVDGVLRLKQRTPPREKAGENKSNIHMQVGAAVRLPLVFFSPVGWPFSREYQQDVLTLHDWDPVLNQSCGFRHGNRRNRRGLEGTGCSLFWVFLFNPITVSACADWTNTSQVMRLLWKVGQQRYRHGNAMPRQNNGGLYTFYTLRQEENEEHAEDLLVECAEWKGRFRLTRNNNSGLPHDSARHLSVTLAALVCVTASVCQIIREQNRQITFVAGRLSTSLSK